MSRIPTVLILTLLFGPFSSSLSVAGEPELVIDNASRPAISWDGYWLGFIRPGDELCWIDLALFSEPELLQSGVMEFDWGHIEFDRGQESAGKVPPELLVYEVVKSDSLWVMDAVTGKSLLLALGTGRLATPAWSPLTNEIAVQFEDALAVVSYPDGAVTGVPCTHPDDPDGCDGGQPTWSPDGLWIAFEDGRDILKVQRSGGVADTVFSPGIGRESAAPSWSPDGKWIAFARDVEGSDDYWNLWVVGADGPQGGLFQVTSGDFEDFDPEWGFDSRTVYFSSNRSGSEGIWQVPFTPTAVQPTSWGAIKARFK